MAKFRTLKNSLIAGEISPAALARTDLPHYNHACKTLKNAIPTLVGGAYRRPGTFYDHSLPEENYSAPRLIPFVVSETESYIVEIYSDLSGPTGAIALRKNVSTFSQTSTATNNIFGSGFYNYLPAHVIGSGYDETFDVQYFQSNDVMWLVHPNHKPVTVRRTALNNYGAADFDAFLTGTSLRDAYPYRPQNATPTTLTPSATSGSGITITASADVFNSAHVGALFKLNHAGTYGCVKITAYTSATQVTADVVVTLGGTGAVATWWESAWSDYRGWPRTVCVYKNRLAYGGNASDRDSIWFSQAFNYQMMSVDSAADPYSGLSNTQPFTAMLGSNSFNLIQWMSPGSVLAVGTQGEEWTLEPDSGVFGSDNVIFDTKSAFGSAYRQAIRVGGEIYTISRSGDSVRSFVFSDEEKSYLSEPIQLLFAHYPKPDPLYKARKIMGMAWDDSKKCLWLHDSAGNLFGVVRDRKIGVTAWHRHEFGGYDPGVIGSDIVDPTVIYYNLCAGSVLSVTCIPNPVIGTDDVWLTIKRKIDGKWQYHVERIIGKQLAADSSRSPALHLSGAYFADSCVYNGNYVLTGAGSGETYEYSAAHLEGETVVGTVESEKGIFALGEMTVSGGKAQLNEPYPPSFDTIPYQLMIGLPYDTVVEPVRPDAGSVIGTSIGAPQRPHTVTLRFHKTLSAKAGRDLDNLDTVYFREADTPMGESPELFSGKKELSLEANYDSESDLVVVCDEPMPFELTSITYEGMVYDG